ncbi:MAG: ribulose-phosphate 3-epimerase [Oscillospiraceae bacterium]|nr:ribulose-phosphate 3-epimerase [Oscillospiraceae bacterium]
MTTYISASILGADLLHLAEECDRLKANNVDMLHFDVMDGQFVNNISFGLPVLEKLSRYTDIFKDVHLMISDPLKYIPDFVRAGSDMITFHVESNSDADKVIETVKNSGVKCGISVKPGTPVETVYKYLDRVDMVLIMTVEPGFGGQGFIPETAEKIRTLRKYITDNNISIDIEVDGGINKKTVSVVREAGANVLVSGSYLFNASSMADAVASLK